MPIAFCVHVEVVSFYNSPTILIRYLRVSKSLNLQSWSWAMKKNIFWNRVVILAVFALLTGCASSQPMSLSTFQFRCTMSEDSVMDTCETQTTCAPYSDFLSIPQSSLEECLAGCQSVYSHNSTSDFHCSYINNNGRRYCIQYCRTNFATK